MKFNYSLKQNEYTLTNAFCWGVFLGHCRETQTGSLGHRFVHGLIAAIHFLPVISQISSLAERCIIINLGDEQPTDLSKASVTASKHKSTAQKFTPTIFNSTPATGNMKLKGNALMYKNMSNDEVINSTKKLVCSMMSEGKTIPIASLDDKYSKDANGTYISKSNSAQKFITKGGGQGFDRVLGKKWVDQIIKENNYDKVKTPSSILALGPQSSFYVTEGGNVDFTLNFKNPTPSQLYLEEKIEHVDRYLSKQEAIQFAAVLAKSRYRDFDPGNYVIGKDAIYLTDLDEQAFVRFGPPLYDAVYKYVVPLLATKDQQAFTAEWDQLRKELETHNWVDETVKCSAFTFEFNNAV